MSSDDLNSCEPDLQAEGQDGGEDFDGVPTCQNCKFSRPMRHTDAYMSCRLTPPSISAASAAGFWPSVPVDGWCGQWQLRKQPEHYLSMSKFFEGAMS